MIRRNDPIETLPLPRARSPFEQLLATRPQFRRLSLDEYHHLIETGFLHSGEPYELLDGYLVRKDRSATGEDPLTIGDAHVWAVQALVDLNSRLRRLRCHMRVQQPVPLPPDQEPEPDGAVVRGDRNDYELNPLTAADVFSVIEVADSSLERDRTVKMRIYADAGIPQYVIVNLPGGVVEVYTDPLPAHGRYGQSITLRRSQKLPLSAGAGRTLAVPVRELLPRHLKQHP